MKNQNKKKIVKKAYSKIATDSNSSRCCSCGCGSTNSPTSKEISKNIGYSDEELNVVPEANLGLGCGNPTALGQIREGDVVLDLGSGAGFDCFLASKKVGKTGKVIGVDMTEQMIAKAKGIAKERDYSNVEFRLGDIEKMPVEDNSVNVVISNCVINLAPDKSKVFKEAYRVLKSGGKMYVSDIVLLERLSEEQLEDDNLLTGCVAGALLKQDYLKAIKQTGFNVKVLSEDTDLSRTQYNGLPIESIKIEATK